MKAWEVIGYAYDGALYHEGCEPKGVDVDELAPVFASSEMEPGDHCDACFSKFMHERTSQDEPVPSHVFLDGCEPEGR